MIWQVLKNSIPIGAFSSLQKAEDCYAEFEADEIREIADDSLEEQPKDLANAVEQMAASPGS